MYVLVYAFAILWHTVLAIGDERCTILMCLVFSSSIACTERPSSSPSSPQSPRSPEGDDNKSTDEDEPAGSPEQPLGSTPSDTGGSHTLASTSTSSTSSFVSAPVQIDPADFQPWDEK